MFLRFLNFVIAGLIFGGFLILIFRPDFFYFIPVVMCILLAAEIWLLCGRNWRAPELRYFVCFLLLFLISSLLFFGFLGNKWLQYGLAALAAGFMLLFLENLYLFFNQPLRYPVFALTNLSRYFGLLTIFFFSVSFFQLLIFLAFPLLPLLFLVFLANAAVLRHFFWVNKIPAEKAWFWTGFLGLLIAEMFLITSILPISVYSCAIIVLLTFYLLSSLSFHHIIGSLQPILVKKYLLATGTFFILILAVSQWS